VVVIVVPLATLAWLGWRLLEQDRILEGQQAQERLERSADLIVATLQRSLSSSEQRLAAGATDWPEGAVSVAFDGDRIDAYPRGAQRGLSGCPTPNHPLFLMLRSLLEDRFQLKVHRETQEEHNMN
jgi:hypothetical protein